MTRPFLLLALATSMAADLSGQQPHGSYEIRICRMECSWNDESRLVASGLLVLDADLRAPSLLGSQPRRVAYERSRRYLEDEEGNGINGCFALASATPDPEVFVGIITHGFTGWRSEPDGTLRFPLYYSPDASYDVTLVRSGAEWIGRGVSASVVAEMTGAATTQEFVRMRRTGAPAPDRCFSGVEGFEDTPEQVRLGDDLSIESRKIVR